RAEVRMNLAEDRNDLEEAERALADVLAAKEDLADNPYVLSVNLLAHVVAANLYLDAGKMERRRALLDEAERTSRVLETLDRLVYPFTARWAYLEQTSQESACFALARRASQKSNAPIFAYQYALALYRTRQFDEALEVLDGRKWRENGGDCLRGYVLAELHPQN